MNLLDNIGNSLTSAANNIATATVNAAANAVNNIANSILGSLLGVAEGLFGAIGNFLGTIFGPIVFDGGIGNPSGPGMDIGNGGSMPIGGGISEKPTDAEPGRLPSSVIVNKSYKITTDTSWTNENGENLLLDRITGVMQNAYGYPYHEGTRSGMLTDTYDYQILLDDPKYKQIGEKTFEDRLKEVRAEFGIPVHGSNAIATEMKLNMYNRFMVPDTNLARSKDFTYIFFTRPDLNLLQYRSPSLVQQCQNHPTTAVMYKRYPDIFELLMDPRRCSKYNKNYFNLLLSNQVASFNFDETKLSTETSKKNWYGIAITYGNTYDYKTDGTFECTFTETSNYLVINLLKLWTMYIDNVSKGQWSPSYNLFGSGVSKTFTNSHVYSKTLDYAASAYAFKCAADGETILYWTKYYGIFPINDGSGQLSWNKSSGISKDLELSIQFAYSFKRDLDPINLIEFNHNANIESSTKFEESLAKEGGYSRRPYVGTPFVESVGDLNNTQFRLRFASPMNNDDKYFKSSLGDHKVGSSSGSSSSSDDRLPAWYKGSANLPFGGFGGFGTGFGDGWGTGGAGGLPGGFFQ